MPATAKNYDSAVTAHGPTDIWLSLAIPGAGAEITLFTDGTPDETANPSARHVGMRAFSAGGDADCDPRCGVGPACDCGERPSSAGRATRILPRRVISNVTTIDDTRIRRRSCVSAPLHTGRSTSRRGKRPASIRITGP